MIPEIDIRTVDINELQKVFTTGTNLTGTNCALLTGFLNDEQKLLLDRWYASMVEFYKQDSSIKAQTPYRIEDHVGYKQMSRDRFFIERFLYYPSRMTDNDWPESLDKNLATKIVSICDDLTFRILALLDQMIGSGTTLVDAHKPSLNTSGLLYYPAYRGPLYKEDYRHGVHADYNLFTLFWQIPSPYTDITGLEVKDLVGKWHKVQRKEYGVTLCFANALEYWSNNFFKSTPHRVTNNAIEFPRYTMTHYIAPRAGTVLENLSDYNRGNDLVLSGGGKFAADREPLVTSWQSMRAINSGWKG
tara:strand:+ start:863 stop:1771 length:909 start_codon:yes stop_codon:yes gene_type:complete